MTTYAKILTHSISEAGYEAITYELRFPRIILAEFLTHRNTAKNTSSTRAIPTNKMIKNILTDLYEPVFWGKNKSGMQSKEKLTGIRLILAKGVWRVAAYTSCFFMSVLGNHIGLHKQHAGRVAENFGYVTLVFTTTNLSNFFALRDHEDAQPEIQLLAHLMFKEYSLSTPTKLLEGEWHLPYIGQYDRKKFSTEDLIKISVARCASTSYKTVDGKEMTSERAISLFDKLLGGVPIHASPAEHQLTPDTKKLIDIRDHGTKKWETREVWAHPELHGATHGFIQFRKTLPNEFIGPKTPGRLA